MSEVIAVAQIAPSDSVSPVVGEGEGGGGAGLGGGGGAATVVAVVSPFLKWLAFTAVTPTVWPGIVIFWMVGIFLISSRIFAAGGVLIEDDSMVLPGGAVTLTFVITLPFANVIT